MRNEFEKQVRQKMEELDLVPSGPVWGKIEEQIRQKKDRRRLILWLPILFLLLGGGAWWLNSTPEGGKAQPVRQADATAPATAASGTIRPVEKASVATPEPSSEVRSSDPLEKARSQSQKAETVGASVALRSQTASLTSRSQARFRRAGTSSAQLKQANTGSESSLPGSMNSLPEKASGNEGALSQATPSVPRTSAATRDSIRPKKDTLVAKTDSQAVVLQKPAARKNRHAWRFGVTGSIGVSGSASAVRLFPDKALMDVNNTPPLGTTGGFGLSPGNTPIVNYNYASPLRKSLSYSAGLTAVRSLSPHFSFSTGLEYSFFSTRTEVGLKINQSSVPAAPGRNNSAYYINYGTALQPYYNQYHFLSLPVGLEYKPLRRLPLQVRAALSVKRLLKTNALQYDSRALVYYYYPDAFRKTQLYSSFGLGWSLLKNKSLEIGPGVEYGITRNQLGSDNHHLFAFRMGARLLLK